MAHCLSLPTGLFYLTMIEPTDNILSAARDCYLKQGIAATGMKEVAEAAGLARSTVYRYFSTRDELLVSTIKVEMEALNHYIREKLKKYPDPADQLVEGLIVAIREIPQRPLLEVVFASADGGRARDVIWRSDVIVRFGEELMNHVVIPARQAGLLQDAVQPEILVEWVYRLLLSFLTLPSNWIKSDRQLRTTLRALLVPVLLT